MPSIEEVLDGERPGSVAQARENWPARERYTPSPADWRDECLYFFLPDRFSDAPSPLGPARPLLDRRHLAAARGGSPAWTTQEWAAWAESGRTRFQGGTLRGAAGRLGYLQDLGVTALWVGPVWKQRRDAFRNDDGAWGDEYHGYAVQDFFDVDPRFGTRRDLVDLVDQAHAKGIKVIVDVIINHTARNWLYRVDGALLPVEQDPSYDNAWPYEQGRVYDFGAWLDGNGEAMPAGAAFGRDDAVWPSELQRPDAYHRMGEWPRGWGDSPGDWDPRSFMRVVDMYGRDLDLSAPTAQDRSTLLDVMITVWTYWIALTDCDGFRIDTLKHVALEEARSFCGAVKEYAETLGKDGFLLAGELAGGQAWEDGYLEALGTNLDAALAINQERVLLRSAALGRNAPGAAPGATPGDAFLDRFRVADPDPLHAPHRLAGSAFVTSIDDHDDVATTKQRFPGLTRVPSPGADPQDVDTFSFPLQAVPGVAMLVLTLGIPCLYYGTEQGLTGPAVAAPEALPGWDAGDHGGDRYLREAMFGPQHPRRLGPAGRPAVAGDPTPDVDVPGFGPFGTSGAHVFDPTSPVYRRVQTLLRARAAAEPLRSGRQYARAVTAPGQDAALGPRVPGVIAWSRLLAWQEVVVVVNANVPADAAGPPAAADVQVLVDANLHPDGSAFRCVASTAQCDGRSPGLDAGTSFVVSQPATHRAFVTLRGLLPHEVVVLARDALTP